MTRVRVAAGGGIIKAPLMLELGVPPDVSSSSCCAPQHAYAHHTDPLLPTSPLVALYPSACGTHLACCRGCSSGSGTHIPQRILPVHPHMLNARACHATHECMVIHRTCVT